MCGIIEVREVKGVLEVYEYMGLFKIVLVKCKEKKIPLIWPY